jgi:hypothetical protein
MEIYRITQPRGDEISCAIAVMLQMEMNEADSDMEGFLAGVYVDPEVSPANSISSDHDSN